MGHASSVVTADLTAAAIYKTSGALVHWREGSPNVRLAAFLICGSVPMALLGPHLVRWISPKVNIDTFLTLCIGFALLLAAMMYALLLYVQLRRRAKGLDSGGNDPIVRPVPTILVGGLGGLLRIVTFSFTPQPRYSKAPREPLTADLQKVRAHVVSFSSANASRRRDARSQSRSFAGWNQSLRRNPSSRNARGSELLPVQASIFEW